MTIIDISMLLFSSSLLIISSGFCINYLFQIVKLQRSFDCKLKTLYPLYTAVIFSMLVSILIGYHIYIIIIS